MSKVLSEIELAESAAASGRRGSAAEFKPWAAAEPAPTYIEEGVVGVGPFSLFFYIFFISSNLAD